MQPEITQQPVVVSPRGTLLTADWKSIGKGALVSIAGALLAYLPPVLVNIQYVVTYNGHSYDLTAGAVIVGGFIANFVRKLITEKQYVVNPEDFNG